MAICWRSGPCVKEVTSLLATKELRKCHALAAAPLKNRNILQMTMISAQNKPAITICRYLAFYSLTVVSACFTLTCCSFKSNCMRIRNRDRPLKEKLIISQADRAFADSRQSSQPPRSKMIPGQDQVRLLRYSRGIETAAQL